MNIEKICLGYTDGELTWAVLHVDAPIGWWSDFVSYDIGEIEDAQNVRFKIMKRPVSWDDFDSKALVNYGGSGGGKDGPDYRYAHAMLMAMIIESLNTARDRYLGSETRGPGWEHMAGVAWEQIIGLLPQSYIVRKDLSLDKDDIKKILRLPRGGHHWDDLQNFLLKRREKKV